MQFTTGDQVTTVADFRRLKTKYPYILIMPQSRFLDFMAPGGQATARRFRLVLGANVQRLVQENGVTKGVRYRDANNRWHEVRAALTVGADGRFSKIRSLAGVEPVKATPPMDVVWFRLPRRPGRSSRPDQLLRPAAASSPFSSTAARNGRSATPS